MWDGHLRLCPRSSLLSHHPVQQACTSGRFTVLFDRWHFCLDSWITKPYRFKKPLIHGQTEFYAILWLLEEADPFLWLPGPWKSMTFNLVIQSFYLHLEWTQERSSGHSCCYGEWEWRVSQHGQYIVWFSNDRSLHIHHHLLPRSLKYIPVSFCDQILIAYVET